MRHLRHSTRRTIPKVYVEARFIQDLDTLASFDKRQTRPLLTSNGTPFITLPRRHTERCLCKEWREKMLKGQADTSPKDRPRSFYDGRILQPTFTEARRMYFRKLNPGYYIFWLRQYDTAAGGFIEERVDLPMQAFDANATFDLMKESRAWILYACAAISDEPHDVSSELKLPGFDYHGETIIEGQSFDIYGDMDCHNCYVDSALGQDMERGTGGRMDMYLSFLDHQVEVSRKSYNQCGHL